MDALRPCPDSALLAAFIDGTLVDYERTAVVSHLSECAQCRAVAFTVVDIREATASDEQWHRAVPQPPPLLGETRAGRWARAKTRAPAFLLAVAATIAAVVVPVLFIFPAWSSRHSSSTVANTIDGRRPIEARVSGGFPYAPPPSPQPSPDSSGHWQLIAAADRVRETNENDYGVRSRTTLGVAELFAGQVDDAVGSLKLAAAAAPDDSRLANDLAAAYYERSQRGARPDDLPAALSAAERAVALDDTFAEAWFNRALIITALGMRAEARAAWQVFLSKDPSSPWAEEARARLQTLIPPATVADWVAIRVHLLKDSTRELAERAVARHSGRARDVFENALLKEWLADTKLGRDTTATDHRLLVLADAFATVNQDRFYRDVVMSLARVTASGQRAAFVRAHEELFAAMALAAASDHIHAAVAFERAEALLTTVGSPYASRARVEAAVAAYNLRRYQAAAALLTAEKGPARAHGYRTLATRAAWMLGIVEFSRNDLAAARREYELMLEWTSTDSDVDVYVAAHVLLANLHGALGDNAEAWRFRIAAASRAEECHLQSTRTNLFLGSAGHALAGGHVAAALLFQTSLLAGPQVNPVSEVQFRSQRANAFFRLGRQEAANAEIRAARARLAVLPRTQIRANVTADLLTVESEGVQAIDPHRALSLAEQALTNGNDPQDLLRQARLRMRVAEAAFANGQLDRADRSTADAIDAVDTLRATAGDESAVSASDQALSFYARASEIALRRGDVARAFDYSERRRIQSSAELRAWSRDPRRLQTIQSQLDGDTAVAVFTQIGDRLQLWIIRRNDVATHGVDITAARAAGLVAAHLDEVSRSIAAPGMSSELYETLIRPVQRLLTGARHVVVVADAPYNRVAFAGLWDRRNNRYLVEDHRLVAAPSASAYLTTMARSRAMAPGRRTSIAFATTSPPPGGTSRHTFFSALASAYPAGDVGRNDASTPGGVLRDLAERDVVHISAAFATNQQSVMGSRLLMADEPGRRYSGSISAWQLASSPTMRARLVAFDARPERRGEMTVGVSAFATALLAKGVSAVVGPSVQMPAADLERTWLHFHRHYGAGTTAAESLQRAQLAALDESNRRTGPWATLAVFGSTE